MGRAGGCGPASAGGRLTLTLTLTLTDGAGRRTGSHSTHSIERCSTHSIDRATVLTSSCIGARSPVAQVGQNMVFYWDYDDRIKPSTL